MGGFDWGQFGTNMASEGGSAGFGGLGKAFDKEADRKTRHEMLDFNQAQDYISYIRSVEQDETNYARQKEFAQHGLLWKVRDAIDAGLHPIYAMGGAGSSYAPGPIEVGTTKQTDYTPSSFGDTFTNMGQSVSRAIRATQTEEERLAAGLRIELMRTQIKETDARALYYASEAAKNRTNDDSAKAFPSEGAVKIRPVDQFSKEKGNRSTVAGDHATWGKYHITPETTWRLPYSPGESPFEGLEGMLPQLLAAYVNLWYDPKKELTQKLRLKFPAWYDMHKKYREHRRIYEKTYR